MTSDVQGDASWSALSATEPAGRIEAMRQRFEALADLDQPAREQQAQAMILAEFELDDDSLTSFTESRLRSWMAMAGANLERAQSVASAYHKAFERVPGGIAMKHAAVVQTVARTAVTPVDVDVLYELIPRLLANVPRASQESVGAVGTSTTASSPPPERMSSKPWWKFWG